MLVIHNVTYDYQGRYVCKASNIISGTERHSQSEPIDLSVMGKKMKLLFSCFFRVHQTLSHLTFRDLKPKRWRNILRTNEPFYTRIQFQSPYNAQGYFQDVIRVARNRRSII